MPKVVYNNCYGGFSLSVKGLKRLLELKGIKYKCVDDDLYEGAEVDGKFISVYNFDIDRTDPHLVQMIEELGEEANGRCAKLEFRELPSGTQYYIDEYDGFEVVRTPDDYDWRTVP